MKYLFIIFFLILLITPNKASTCIFTGGGLGNILYNITGLLNPLFWTGGVPTSVDDVIVSIAATFNISSNITWNSLTTSNSNNFVLDLSNNSVLTLSTNLVQNSALTINVNSGSSLVITQHLSMNTNVTINNQGSISLNLLATTPILDGTLKVTGNNVVITGTSTQTFNTTLFLPAGFTFSSSNQIAFLGTGESANSISFNNNNPTISPLGWSTTNCSMSFVAGGATFSGNISRLNQALTRILTFSSASTFYISGNIVFDLSPLYNVNGTINFVSTSSGSSLTYTNKNIGLSSNISGNATVIHNNPTTNAANTITSILTGVEVYINNPNFQISGRYTFHTSNSNTYIFADARSIDAILILNANLKLIFLSNVTLSAQTTINGPGRITFTNGLTSNAASIDFSANSVEITFSGSTFNLVGTSIKFGVLILNGCALNSQSMFSLTTNLTVTANSSLPSQSLVNFTASNPKIQSPSSSISLTLNGDYSLPFAQNWDLYNLNLIITGNFRISEGGILRSLDGTAFVTLTGNQLSFGSGTSISGINLIFPSGNVNVVGIDDVWVTGPIYLQNTFLSGNASFLLFPVGVTQPKIHLLKSGLCGISLPSLVFNTNLDLVYSVSGVGAQLQLASSGTFNGNITGSPNLTVTFQDSSLRFTGNSINANGGAFVFAGASITTNQTVAVSGDIYLNNTSSFRFQLNSTGSYDLSAVSKFFTVGSINHPTESNDAPVTTPNNLYIGLLGTTTLGSSFTKITGTLTIDDLDNNSTTAAYSLTLNGDQEQTDQWTLGGSLIINGDFEVSTNTGLNAPGSLTLNSSNINLNVNSAVWNCSVSFTNGRTVLNSNAGPVILNINDPPESYPEHGVIFAGIFTSNTDTSLVITGPFKPLTVTINNGGLNGTSVTLNNCNVNSGASVFVNPTSLSCSNVNFNGVNFDLTATNTVVFNGNNSIVANASLNNIQIAASSKLSLNGSRTTTGSVDLLASSSSFYASAGVVTAGNINPGSGSFWVDGTNLTCTSFNLTASTHFQYTITPANIPVYVTATANYDGNAYIFINYTWNGSNVTIIQSPAHTGLSAFANVTVNLFNYAIHVGLNLNSLVIFADIQSTTPPSTTPPSTTAPSTLTPSTLTPSTLTPSTLTPTTNPTNNPATLSPTSTPSGSWNGTYTVSGNCQKDSSCCCFIGTTAVPVTIIQTSSSIQIFGSLTGSCTGNFQLNTTVTNLNGGTFVFNNQTYSVSKKGKSITVTNTVSSSCNFNLNCLSGLCNSSNLLYISYFMFFVIFLFTF